jgi:uncharacterized RDD family membrane protein YckC
VGQIGPVYVPQNAQPAESIPAIPAASMAIVQPVYAGFWRRAIAFLIDNLILGFIVAVIIASNPPKFMVDFDLNAPTLKLVPPFTRLGFIVVYFVMWIYFSFFEASAWQATPGKRILRIYVTDIHGQRPTFVRAAFRNVARMISALLVVGYILAGFTAKKQALHDLLASCLVLRRPEPRN